MVPWVVALSKPYRFAEVTPEASHAIAVCNVIAVAAPTSALRARLYAGIVVLTDTARATPASSSARLDVRSPIHAANGEKPIATTLALSSVVIWVKLVSSAREAPLFPGKRHVTPCDAYT